MIETNEDKKSIESRYVNWADDLLPNRVLRLFRNISPRDCVLLGFNDNRPEDLILTSFLVPPNTIRPNVKQGADPFKKVDSLTSSLNDIISCCDTINELLRDGAKDVYQFLSSWDELQ